MKRILALFIVLIFGTSSSLFAAVALDATSNTYMNGDGNHTWSHTNASDATIICVWVLLRNYQESATGVTYGGDALSLKQRVDRGSGNGSVVELWYKVSPKTGANNVVVTTTGYYSTGVAIATSYKGVDTSVPFGTSQSSFAGTGTGTATAAVSSATGEVVIDGVEEENYAGTLACGQTERANISTQVDPYWSALVAGVSEKAGAAPNVTMAWTWTSNSTFAHLAIPLKPTSAASPGHKLNLLGVGR